ncbi:MAG: AMP-binding protein [Pyrinomonadaceae bacterium]
MSNGVEAKEEFAWRPDEGTRLCARLTEFLSVCGLGSFDELHRRSIADVPWFTSQVLSFLKLEFDPPYTQVLDLSRGAPHARWCIGGGLNIARFCVDRHLGTSVEAKPAVIWEGEEGTVRSLTYGELSVQVERCAGGLRSLGLQSGDPVAVHLPMMIETIVGLLAIARIGAIAVPIFSGYGSSAIAARLADVGARALVTCDAFPRRGQTVHAKSVADEAAQQCPELKHVIVVRRMGEGVPLIRHRDMYWEDLLQKGAMAESDARVVAATDAEDPLIVLYTSGTTGQPKGILHAHCGFPVKAAQDMAFGTDVGPGTVISWVTDIGWMMGPWLIYGATLLGATIALLDGAPDYPGPDRMWEFCARHKIEVLGISPTLVRALAAQGDEHPAKHDLSRLRILASTGEPWNPDPWWWLFNHVGRGLVPIINYSGGTEISGGILMGNPLLPLKPCSFPAPCPGIAADVTDEAGQSVPKGTVGELVIRQPWIGMARGFWKDPEKYLATYWSRVPDVWVHGDWARVDEDGQWYILGRSDDTLKVAGKRVGPAEVESVLVAHPRVAEAAVIGVPDEIKGNAMIAFCVLTADAPETEITLAEELRQRVASALGKPLRPEKVLFVSGLPKTRNAKVMRRVIRAAYLGEDPGDITALENPRIVDEIQGINKRG